MRWYVVIAYLGMLANLLWLLVSSSHKEWHSFTRGVMRRRRADGTWEYRPATEQDGYPWKAH